MINHEGGFRLSPVLLAAMLFPATLGGQPQVDAVVTMQGSSQIHGAGPAFE